MVSHHSAKVAVVCSAYAFESHTLRHYEGMIMKTYIDYANENKDLILECINKNLSKTKIAELIGCNRKTFQKCLDYLGIKYNYYAYYSTKNSDEKTCTCCNQVKSLEDFYYSNGKYSPYCKECTRQKEQERYRNKKEQLDKWKISHGGCKKCGNTKPYLLDMHHLNPEEKDFTISDAIRLNFTSEKFQQEMDKCIILCANCHREFHYLESKNHITIEEYLKDNN